MQTEHVKTVPPAPVPNTIPTRLRPMPVNLSPEEIRALVREILG